MGLVIAAIVIGFWISLGMNEIGMAIMLSFGFLTILATLVVEVRGLYLTVASIPLAYCLTVLASGWALVKLRGTGEWTALSKTEILTAIYPVTTHFPWVMLLTFVVTLIAVFRLYLVRRRAGRTVNRVVEQRQHAERTNQRTRALSDSARRRGEQITVQELLERARERSAAERSGSAAGSTAASRLNRPR